MTKERIKQINELSFSETLVEEYRKVQKELTDFMSSNKKFKTFVTDQARKLKKEGENFASVVIFDVIKGAYDFLHKEGIYKEYVKAKEKAKKKATANKDKAKSKETKKANKPSPKPKPEAKQVVDIFSL